MSYLKPDYDYIPPETFYTDDDKKKNTRVPVEGGVDKDTLQVAVKSYANGIEDANLYRFFINTALAFRTNTNVLDSVAFFKKFTDGYLFSLKQNFPNLTQEQFDSLEKNLKEIEKTVANLLHGGNVENKYLVALTLGMMEGMLNFENY